MPRPKKVLAPVEEVKEEVSIAEQSVEEQPYEPLVREFSENGKRWRKTYKPDGSSLSVEEIRTIEE